MTDLAIEALRPFARALIFFGDDLAKEPDNKVWFLNTSLGDYRRALQIVETANPGYEHIVRNEISTDVERLTAILRKIDPIEP